MYNFYLSTEMRKNRLIRQAETRFKYETKQVLRTCLDMEYVFVFCGLFNDTFRIEQY
jgi:hypothetical protein